MRLLSLLFVAVLCASELDAQAGPRPQHLSATWMRDSIAAAGRLPNAPPATPLGDQGIYRYVGVRRDKTGEAEIHAAFDDLFVVQEGAGTLLYGGRLEGSRETAPGELRGGQIVGGTSLLLSAGDMKAIPAGVAHHVHVPSGGSITYLVVKIPRQR